MVNVRLPVKSKNGILQPVVIANFAPLKTHVGIEFLNALCHCTIRKRYQDLVEFYQYHNDT